MFSFDFTKISAAGPSYTNAIKKCFEEWKFAKSEKELVTAILLSSESYMLPTEIWDEVMKLGKSETEEPDFYKRMNLLKTFVNPAYFQFYFEIPYVYCPDRKDLNWFPKDEINYVSQKEANFYFSFPHKSLDLMWKYYSEHSASPPPKATIENYERMKKLYNEIIQVEDDLEKWYQVLKEVGDETVIEHNLEYRLCLNLSDKQLWKIYLEFLEVKDTAKFFQAVAKYCRYFLDDDEMKVKYNEMAIKYEYFIPENDFLPSEAKGISGDEIWEEYSCTETPPPTHYFNTENSVFQSFPFQKPLINYVIINADGKMLQKLFKTCKLFYSIFPVQIFYKFEFRTRRENLYLKDRVIFLNSLQIYGEQINYMSDLIIPKIYKCEARHINISRQNLKSEEFEVLVGHGNVVNLDLAHVEITDSKTREILDAADILKLTPKIEFICLINVHYGIQTTQKLLEIPFQNKIHEIVASFYTPEIEPFECSMFLVKNVSPMCHLLLGFEGETEETCDYFYETVRDCIDQNWTGKYKPTFEWFP